MCDQMDLGWRFGITGGFMLPSGPQEPRDMQVALQQHAANVGAGCDPRPWHDRSAASRALGIAADAVNIVGGEP